MQLVKKLGPKQILGDVKSVVKKHCKKDNDTVEGFSMYGILTNYETGESSYGTWYAFIGRIEAVNHFTGEVLTSSKCFIASPLQELIKEAIDEGNEAVDFALTTHLKRRDELKEGYEYICEPRKETETNDPLSELRGIIDNTTKRLSGPKSKAKAKGKR